DYSLAIEQEPMNKNYLEIRAFTHHRLRQYYQALADLNHCVDLQPDNTLSYYWRGLIYLNVQDFESALEDINYSQTLDSDNPISLAYCSFWRGITYFLMDNQDMALAEICELQSTMSTIEDDTQCWRIQALWHLFNDESDLARTYYAKILAEDSRFVKLFSPCLYLIQLERLFPERNDFQEMFKWLNSQIT